MLEGTIRPVNDIGFKTLGNDQTWSREIQTFSGFHESFLSVPKDRVGPCLSGSQPIYQMNEPDSDRT